LKQSGSCEVFDIPEWNINRRPASMSSSVTVP